MHTLRLLEIGMLAAHDAITTTSREIRTKMGKIYNRVRRAPHTASLDLLPETKRPPGPDKPATGEETKAFAKARHWSLQWAELPPAFGRDWGTLSE